MKVKTLVFGDGLLGNTFKTQPKTAVLSRKQCDITQKDQIKDALNYYRPETVINAAGIVPRHADTAETMFKVNSFAPHYIADLCDRNTYFIHISTDCVFSGDKGNYTERDVPDATDMYGMSKLFGEPYDGLVIRTSFVGIPDPKQRGLLAWAQSQKEIIGYDKVLWNGVTVKELVNHLQIYIGERVTGTRHVYSYTVSKYELLTCAKEVFGWTMPIYRDTESPGKNHICNKTLSSIYANGFIVKPIRQQLKELL